MIHYSKGYLSRIETCTVPPNAALARQCDGTLSAGGALTALVPREECSRGAAAGARDEWTFDLAPGEMTHPASTNRTGTAE